MVEDPEKVLEQMRPYLQWNIGADLLFKELQHCLTPEIQKTIKEQIKHDGNKIAVETILDQLLCKDDWPLQLYHALLSPSINRPKLARKLKGSKTEEDSRKELDHSSMSDSVQFETEKKFECCTGKRKMKNLPMIFLNTLKQNLDIEDGWKLLAVQLGYSSDDVAYIHFKDGSPTEHLIHHWIQENQDADLETIFSSLHKMEYESLSKELHEICECTHECMGGASSLVKDEPAISIPDFNPVPDLLPSINDSLKKGEHVSPTISPVIPHKTVITEMDMPKYSESYDQDCNTLVGSKLASEKKVESLNLFDSNKDADILLIKSSSSMESPLSSEFLNDSSTSRMSKSLECSADVTNLQITDSGFMETIDAKNQNFIEQSNELEILAKNPLLLDNASNDNVSKSTSNSKYNHNETVSTLLKCSDPLFEQIKSSKPESCSTHFHSEENDKIENEPEMEKESTDTKRVSGSEVKTAKMFVENVLESALTHQFTIEDPSVSFKPEITSPALEVNVENIDIKENETDSLVRSQESANSEELQNDLGIVSQEYKPISTNTITVLKNDIAITQREDSVSLSDSDNIKKLSGEDAKNTEIVSKEPLEIEDYVTDSTMKPVISEDKNVSQLENNSELIVLKEDIQDINEQIKVASSKMANKASDTNSGSIPNIPVLESREISLSELAIESDTKDLKAEVIVPVEPLDSVASTSLSKITSKSVTETINSDVISDIHTSEKLVEISTTESSEVQSDVAVLNIADIPTSISVTSKMVPEECLASTVELKDPVLADSVTLPNTEMTNNEVKSLITFPEINDQEIQAANTLAEINSEVKMKTDKDFRDEVEISDSSSETKAVVKEEKKIALASQAVEVSSPKKDSDSIPLDGLSLHQYISSEEKSRFTYHYFGYIVLGMAIVGSGMLFLRRYLK